MNKNKFSSIAEVMGLADPEEYELEPEGELVCELNWSNSLMEGTSSIKKIDEKFYVDDEVEFYGPFDSLDSALENVNSCRFISDAVTSIYIQKPVDEVDWVIVAENGYKLTINSEEYIVKDEKLVKI